MTALREPLAGADPGCPMDCDYCQAPGDCEDCLDCLSWPEPYVEPPRPPEPPTARGYAIPLMSEDLEAARTRVTTARCIGLVLRTYRKAHQMSQRALADELGWSHATIGRVEVDASRLSLGTVEALLERTGHRLAIVVEDGSTSPIVGELTATSWGMPDLVARNGGGRRLPPYGRPMFRPEMDRIQDEGIVGHRQPWVWQRPH